MKRAIMKFNMQLVDEKTASLDIFDEIGEYYDWWGDRMAGVGPNTVTEFLEANKSIDTINVRINSNGGDVFEGIAIGNLLRGSGKKINVEIVGLAASIASVIAMAGDTVRMYPTSQMMVHNCWTWACGNANDLRQLADQMDKIMESSKVAYLDKSGGKLSAEKLQELLDGESYLTAQECLDYGLADEIVGKEPEEKITESVEKPKPQPNTQPVQKMKNWFF